MLNVVMVFISLVAAVVGAFSGDVQAQNKLRHPAVEVAQFQPTANASMNTAFSGPRETQTIRLNDADWTDVRNGCRPGQDCKPGNGASPPAFHGPGRSPAPQYPPQGPPQYQYPPQAPIYGDGETRLGLFGIFAILGILICGGIGGYVGYSAEKEKERLENEAEAAKAQAFRESALAMNKLEKRPVAAQ